MGQKGILYDRLAEYYDQIYHWKDYRKEAKKLKELIQGSKRTKVTSLLDVGCGTGKHLQYLRKDFDCIGIDASERMLEIARKNAPGTEFMRADMRDFELGRRFGAVTCLFSGIGHLRTRSQVSETIRKFGDHLEMGGVVVIEPWIAKSEWKNRTVSLQTYEGSSLKIARVNFAQSRGDFSVLDFHYLIAEKGKGITYLRDHQELRFFEVEETLGAMRRAGLDARFSKKSLMPGRGLLIGVKVREPSQARVR